MCSSSRKIKKCIFFDNRHRHGQIVDFPLTFKKSYVGTMKICSEGILARAPCSQRTPRSRHMNSANWRSCADQPTLFFSVATYCLKFGTEIDIMPIANPSCHFFRVREVKFSDRPGLSRKGGLHIPIGIWERPDCFRLHECQDQQTDYYIRSETICPGGQNG